MSDVLGRDACIADLLRRSHVAPDELCIASAVRPVLARLLASHMNWLTVHLRNVATVAVIKAACPAKHCLATCVQEWVPATVRECCGRPLVRWRLLPTTFFTLAAGLRPGHVVCLRWYSCKTVFAGCWKLPDVADDSLFPDGFHAPVLACASLKECRWFFATPQVIFEIPLLHYTLGLLARGGISFTAFTVVYTGMWLASMQGTMYMYRTKFLQKLEVTIRMTLLFSVFLGA